MNEPTTQATHPCGRLVGPSKPCGSRKREKRVESLPGGGEQVTVVCADCGARQYSYLRGGGETRGRGLRAKRRAEMDALGMNMREWSIHKARDWTNAYGVPPVSMDWNLRGARTKFAEERLAELERRHREALWPSTTTVLSQFDSWNSFLAEAGLEPVASGQKRYR